MSVRQNYPTTKPPPLRYIFDFVARGYVVWGFVVRFCLYPYLDTIASAVCIASTYPGLGALSSPKVWAFDSRRRKICYRFLQNMQLKITT